MYKNLFIFFAAFIVFLNIQSAKAMNYSDVPDSFWAYEPIMSLSSEGIITGFSDGSFKPNGYVKRADFSTMLVKALSQENLEPSNNLPYTDVNKSICSAYNDICRINDLKLVVGYPDNTYRPNNNITKAEIMVILANTLSGTYLESEEAQKILSAFKDRSSVPTWALGSVSKSVKNEYFVNYPDPSMIAASNQATRAEVADLLYKLRKNLLAKIKEKEQEINITEPIMDNEIPAVEHLPNIYSDKGINEVQVKRLEATIMAGNIIKTAFVSDFKSKKNPYRSKVQLVLTDDIYTKEGTFLIPKGSIFEGTVSTNQGPKMYNKNGKVGFDLTQLILPSGKTYDISAKIATPNGLLEQSYTKRNFKRDALVTLGAAGFGAALGALTGLEDHSGVGSIIGVSSGLGVGAVTAAFIPGYPLDFKKGDKVYIKFVNDITVDR